MAWKDLGPGQRPGEKEEPAQETGCSSVKVATAWKEGQQWARGGASIAGRSGTDSGKN